MQLVLFSKRNKAPINPTILEWDHSKIKEILEEVSKNGVICLISESSYQILSGSFIPVNYLRCKIKKDEVELYRAFHFDNQTDRLRRKILFFPASSITGCKSGVNTFFNKKFTVTDPACMIIVPDIIMNLLVKSYSRPDINRMQKREKNEDNPLGELLQETANHPIIQKVSQVYIGNSYDMRLARLLILKASQSKSNVLILGETGTGKDVIARQIAENSIHYKKSFLHFHCAGTPDLLLEAELFGYMKGAFTGAMCNKEGIFVAKKNGTIFLDEFGDLSLPNQVKLLLAIDSKIVRPIGSNDNIPIDVRILAATSRNVDYMAMNGLFREDLLFRLNDFRITAPSLRTHPEDIPEIAIHLWKKIHPDGELSIDFLNYLKSFPWTGNVRELRSMLTKISDIFGNISPTRKHIDDIRQARLENVQNYLKNPPDETKQLKKLDTTLKLTDLLNIVRGIKVAMRPVINNELTPANFTESSETIKHHIDSKIRLIDSICLQPLNIKDYELFKKTTRYRYLLEKMLKCWPDNPDSLRKSWSAEYKKLDDYITRRLIEMI